MRIWFVTTMQALSILKLYIDNLIKTIDVDIDMKAFVKTDKGTFMWNNNYDSALDSYIANLVELKKKKERYSLRNWSL